MSEMTADGHLRLSNQNLCLWWARDLGTQGKAPLPTSSQLPRIHADGRR